MGHTYVKSLVTFTVIAKLQIVATVAAVEEVVMWVVIISSTSAMPCMVVYYKYGQNARARLHAGSNFIGTAVHLLVSPKQGLCLNLEHQSKGHPILCAA